MVWVQDLQLWFDPLRPVIIIIMKYPAFQVKMSICDWDQINVHRGILFLVP